MPWDGLLTCIYLYDDTHGFMMIGILRSYGALWTDLHKGYIVGILLPPTEAVVAGIFSRREE